MGHARATVIGVALFALGSAGAITAGHLASGGHAQAATPAPTAVPSLFVPIDAFRTMDTRIEPAVLKVATTPLGPLPRNPGDSQAGGPSPVPDNATAITYNITVTETEGAGFVQVDRYSTADGSTSTINWTGDGQTHANSGVVQLEPADFGTRFGVYVGGAAGAQTHIVIDITGYFIPADAT